MYQKKTIHLWFISQKKQQAILNPRRVILRFFREPTCLNPNIVTKPREPIIFHNSWVAPSPKKEGQVFLDSCQNPTKGGTDFTVKIANFLLPICRTCLTPIVKNSCPPPITQKIAFYLRMGTFQKYLPPPTPNLKKKQRGTHKRKFCSILLKV